MKQRHLVLSKIAGALALVALCIGTARSQVIAQPRVELKPSLSVVGPMITLGDIFDNAGDAATTNVIAAPRPGARIAIDAKSLAALAADHGLDWENANGLATVEVARASRRIDAQAIGDAISKALGLQAGGRDLDVRLLQAGLVFNAPADDPSDLKVDIVSFDQPSGRFEAQVTAPGGDRALVNGTADEVMSVPVLARPFQRGEIVQEADISWIKARIDSMGRQVITDPGQIVGLAARRPLRSSQPLITGDIERPSVVAKGALVTMSYKVPGMMLTDQGRALESGAMGDEINVLNERSHRTVQAIVVSANAVELAPSAPIALGAQASLDR